jgi:isoamylase
MEKEVREGISFPLGATVSREGVNFSVFSQHAEAIELLLFDSAEEHRPSRIITLYPAGHRSHHYWHVFVPGLKGGQIYAYRAYGPFQPEKGFRFDPEKTLIDPYGRAILVPELYSRRAASSKGDNIETAMKSVVVDPSTYGWEGDVPLKHPFPETVIYEMHVRGFTRHPDSGVSLERRGTFLGVIDKIPYLRDLGVTAVELLPVFQFDPQDALPGMTNYWGYSPVSFFAPHHGFSSRKDPLVVLDEFRDMVKALHRAGIEVILDVVYNHTAEGNHLGPTLSFKGLANETYYTLQTDRSCYADYSGTGNTMNANTAVVRRLISDSLRYWVSEMHVDGFRFDLASILSRDETGTPLANPPVLWDIQSDPVLAGTKLIVEAWDAAGLYQVGAFVGDSWKEWNGKFRDDIRSFLKGDRGMVSRIPLRLLASPDIYGRKEREPEQSVNFITCHDGFTLNDLVSYNDRHNEANGEQNCDGTDHNLSWNCGVEGPTDDPAVEKLRNRQAKNFLTLTLIALGSPMILMGDEVRRTQRGNNNAYCQDNEISWFDWSLVERHGDILRFTKALLRQRLDSRKGLPIEGLSLNDILRRAAIDWHGVRLQEPDWGDDSHSIAATFWNTRVGYAVHLMVNAYWETLCFELPESRGGAALRWYRWIDTSHDSPDDVCGPSEAPVVDGRSYPVAPRSLVILFTPLPVEVPKNRPGQGSR